MRRIADTVSDAVRYKEFSPTGAPSPCSLSTAASVCSLTMNPEFKDQADAIYRDRVRRARALTPVERLTDALEMLDEVWTTMRAGIRSQFPHADETEVHRIFQARLRRLRQVSDAGIFRPVEPAT